MKFIKLLTGLICFLVMFNSIKLTANAEESALPNILFNNEIAILSEPIVVKGSKVYLDIRDIGKSFDLKVEYDKEAKSIVGKDKKGNNISARLGTKILYKNRKKILLENPLFLINGKPMVSLSFIKDALGLNVHRDNGNEIFIDNYNNDWDYNWTNKNKLVAHAFGGIEGKPYTNSLEAFEYNYSKGHRIFEVDFALTSDGHLVARHDWTANLQKQLEQEIPLEKQGKALTVDEYKALKIHHKYTPLTFEEVAKIMVENKDIYIVTDTKGTLEAEIKPQFNALVEEAKKVDPRILDRIIPQIYNEPMLDTIMAIHDFKSIIYTLYNRYSFDEDEAIKFAYENGIKVVTTYERRYSDRFVSELNKRGIKVFMHTFNSVDSTQKYQEQGVSGFYTDYITPVEME